MMRVLCLTSTFRMAICRATHNSAPQLETMSNVALPGSAVYEPHNLAELNPNGFANSLAHPIKKGVLSLLYTKRGRRSNRREATMGRLYLGITVTSTYALVTMLLILAFWR